MAGFVSIKEKVAELKNKLAAITPEQLVEYAQLWSRGGFHRYSFLNTLHSAIQLGKVPAALAPFSKWKENGIMVNKGTHGLEIYVPMIKETWEESKSPLAAWDKIKLDKLIENKKAKIENGKVMISNSRLVGFSTGKVFDISQTDCTELPENMRGGYMGKYKGCAEMKLADIIKISTVPVNFVPTLGGANGRTNFEEIQLLNGGDENGNIVTFFHELGHNLLDHKNRLISTGTKEAEAEAVAYICGAAVGIEAGEQAAAYIKNWGAAEFDTYHVFNAVEKILNKLGKVVTDEPAAA